MCDPVQRVCSPIISIVSVVLDVKSTFGKLFLEECIGKNEDATILLTDTPHVLIGNYLIGVGGLDVQNFQRVAEIETSSTLGIKQGVIGKYSFSSTSMLRELLVAIQEGQAAGNLGDTKDVLVVWSKRSLDKLIRRNSVWHTVRNLGYVTVMLFVGGLWYKLVHTAHMRRQQYANTMPSQSLVPYSSHAQAAHTRRPQHASGIFSQSLVPSSSHAHTAPTERLQCTDVVPSQGLISSLARTCSAYTRGPRHASGTFSQSLVPSSSHAHISPTGRLQCPDVVPSQGLTSSLAHTHLAPTGRPQCPGITPLQDPISSLGHTYTQGSTSYTHTYYSTSSVHTHRWGSISCSSSIRSYTYRSNFSLDPTHADLRRSLLQCMSNIFSAGPTTS